MKQIKRTAGLLLALVLALVLALPAWAAGYVPPATCTVHFGGTAAVMPLLLSEPAADTTARTWEGYQLLTLDVSLKQEAAAHAHHAADPDGHDKACYNYSYHVRDDAAALTAILLAQADAYKDKVAAWQPVAPATERPTVTKENLVKFMESISDTEAQGFADNVYRAVKAASPAITPDMTAAQHTGDFTAQVAQGYWLFADVTKFSDNTEKVNSLVVLATKGDAIVTVSPKVSLPTLDKMASDTANGTPQENVSVNVGDTVYFTLSGTLPSDLMNYAAYQYVFHDKLSDGLTYTAASAKVCLVKDGAETPLADGVFNVAYNADKRELTITCADLLNVPAVTGAYRQDNDVKLVVKYSAVLGEAALTAKAENNRAYLVYANDPYGTATGKTPEEQVKVYDFDLLIDKYEAGKTDTKLAGAEFILYKEANGTKSYYQWDDTDKKVKWAAETDATRYTTDDNGAAAFKGLAAGTYYLQETKAPAGYNPVKEPLKVVIAKEAADDTATGQLARTVTVENSTGTVLPSTGGMGTVIFYALGAALVLLAVLLSRRQKPDSNRK